MQIFEKYANFYDSYYKTKAYDNEIKYILKLSQKYGLFKIKKALDIGCGTGEHMLSLAKQKIATKGFDLSLNMVKYAKKKISKTKFINLLEVEHGNALNFNFNENYDLILSMFAVVGYINNNKDLVAMLKCVRNHLTENGLFIFDVWHGPAVLHHLPETRIQEFVYEKQKVYRLVKPTYSILDNTVQVHYTILKFNSLTKVEQFEETHSMRYFFKSELAFFAELADLELIGIFPFMHDDRDPSIDDWNICVVMKCRNSKK